MCVCVVHVLCVWGQTRKEKTYSWKQKDEKSVREGVRMCTESSCGVHLSSARPSPFFREVTWAGCPEGQPSAMYRATNT